ncbi:hypothetical protein ACMXYR_13650 [Neptuniibacter sp. QD29_5]|uniref:hypothetical protein n=1 Tax=Neptuniibacter sp. QD29_5 TaxID=3398207 RepID=UPI0039F573F5
MNVKNMLISITASLFSIPILAEPIDPSELLPEPDDFSYSSCNYVPGGENNFILNWSAIPEEGKRPAKKYASEVKCLLQKANPEDEDNPITYGEVEAEATVKASDCEDGACSATIPYSDIGTALTAAIESGEIVLDEGDELTDYHFACEAKVKGLNPPGKSQNHPQAVAQCTVGSCPAWSDEEIGLVGNYSSTSGGYDDREINTSTYPNAIFDQELGGSPWVNTWVLVGYTDEGDHYGVYHFDNRTEDTVWVRKIPLTSEEYEACKQEILDHCTIGCGT